MAPRRGLMPEEHAAYTVTCPTCDAAPDGFCHKQGMPAYVNTRPHVRRIRAAIGAATVSPPGTAAPGPGPSQPRSQS